MWEVLPLSKLGAWDGHCIWKMKDVNRRCSITIRPSLFGSIEELLARVLRGEELTGQESMNLARGLCCLEWHSTEYFAQQICGMWARQSAPGLPLLAPGASLLALESEVERLRKGYAELSRELEKTKATEKQFRDNCAATISEMKKGLEIEIEGLKKALDEGGNANETFQKELLTSQFGFVKEKRRKIVVRLPPIKGVSPHSILARRFA